MWNLLSSSVEIMEIYSYAFLAKNRESNGFTK